MFVVDDLGSWLVELLADAVRKKLTDRFLGTDQERALLQAAAAAIQETASEISPADGNRAEQIGMVIGEVFHEPTPPAMPPGTATLLEGLQAAIANQLTVLDDASLTGTGQSSADALGVPGSALAKALARHLVTQITIRGSRGGPLTPLADQINHDLTHQQGERIEASINGLAALIKDELSRHSDGVSEPANAPEAIRMQPSRSLYSHVLTDALRIAWSLPEESSKASALVVIAKAVVVNDPKRANQLLTEAQYIAYSIADEEQKDYALADMAITTATTDPSRAEHLASSITAKDLKTRTQVRIAAALATTDPDGVEQMAWSITNGDLKARTLAYIAAALATIDRDRAERLAADAEYAAQSIDHEVSKALTLAEIAGIISAAFSGHAERLIVDAERIMWSDFDLQSERLGLDRFLSYVEHQRQPILAEIVDAIAPANPDSAERIARSIHTDWLQVKSLARIAETITSTDPDRADWLIADAEHGADSITSNLAKAWALESVARAVAASDPDRAERIACSINDLDNGKFGTVIAETAASVFGHIAMTVAATDPDHAKRIAYSLKDDLWKVRVLTGIAEAITRNNFHRPE